MGIPSRCLAEGGLCRKSHPRNFMQRSFGERIAMNAPIQGTAADIIKIAMNRVHRRLIDEGFKIQTVVTGA